MDLQGGDPKKSRNLIAVLCYFCEWFDFGVCAVSGWGYGQRGRCPSRFGVEHLGLDPWKCVIFRRLVCLLLFIC